jgi:uncharacterized protein YqgC (DUF456 family)
MEIVIIVSSILCLIAGFIGCVAPVLPGPAFALLALVLFKFSVYGVQGSWVWVCIFGVLVIISSVLDYVVPALGAKKFGGTSAGIWGAVIGTFVGIFFFPLGIILGPFLGALAGELISGKSAGNSLKAAFGTFIGFVLGTGLKIVLCVWISAYMVWILI